MKVEVVVFDFGYLIVEKIAHAKDGKDVAMVQTTFNRPSTPWSTPQATTVIHGQSIVNAITIQKQRKTTL